MPFIQRALPVFSALMLIVFSSQSVLAGDMTVSPVTAQQSLMWVDATDEDGFVTHVPSVNTVKLGDRIRELRNALLKRKNELIELVKAKKLGAKDALITAVMPGGLLYAGYRKHEYAQAQNDLAEVDAEIAEFSSDLIALEDSIGTVAIAVIP